MSQWTTKPDSEKHVMLVVYARSSVIQVDHPVGHVQAWTSLVPMTDQADVVAPQIAMQRR